MRRAWITLITNLSYVAAGVYVWDRSYVLGAGLTLLGRSECVVSLGRNARIADGGCRDDVVRDRGTHRQPLR